MVQQQAVAIEQTMTLYEEMVEKANARNAETVELNKFNHDEVIEKM